jgi:predicted CXXCH cytochrome family protein
MTDPKTTTTILMAAACALHVAASPLGAQPADTQDTALLAYLTKGPGSINHPIGIVPSENITIPAGWPLDSDGTMTCLTCHSALPVPGTDQPPLRDTELGQAQPEQFCVKCHATDGKPTASSMHWIAMGKSHIRSDNGLAGQSAGSLDAQSRQCLSCHDGVSASESRYSTKFDRGPGSVGDPRRDHPIGVAMPTGANRKAASAFQSAKTIADNGIDLPDGTVGCTSCHDLYSTQSKRLVMPVENSALCYGCHEL